MFTLITVIHIVVAVVLVILVLLQDSKGAMGALGGGAASNTVLGAGGGASFLLRLTTVVVCLFAITCISLTRFARNEGSVLDAVGSAPTLEETITGEEASSLTTPEEVSGESEAPEEPLPQTADPTP